MLVKVIGLKEDDSFYSAVVEGESVDAVHMELLECFGIEAHSLDIFINELLNIGFDVYTKLSGVDLETLPHVVIPINLNNDNDIF